MLRSERHRFGLARPFVAVLFLIVAIILAAGCGDSSTPREPQVTQTNEGQPPPNDDLSTLPWKGPQFEADYNNLVPNPAVDPVTTAQRDSVNVFPDRLEFSKAAHPDVCTWSPGRLVVSAPGAGAGRNPFGFARRVVQIRDENGLCIADTEAVGLEDLFQGDFQQTYNQEAAQEVDLSKVDLDWAIANLYQDTDVVNMPGESLADDDTIFLDVDGNPIPGADPFLGKLFKAIKKGVNTAVKAVGAAAKRVIEVAKQVYLAITPASFDGSVKLNKELKFDYTSGLFDFELEQKFATSGKFPMALFMKGSGSIATGLSFNPGLQIGASIPVPGHGKSLSAWANIDSRAQAKIALDLALEAGLRSADGLAGSELEKRLNEDASFAADFLGKAKEKLLGSPDMKPAGGWKRTIYISRPTMQTFAAGPIPVVLTQTFQLDLECGFEAKASLTAKLEFEQNASFKFGIKYENNKVVVTQAPLFETKKRRDVQVLGGGEVSVSCGLIPRINAFVYDTVGLFAGVRGSLVGKAKFDSKCAPDPVKTTPTGEVSLGLYGNVGVQVGARIQAPGSSYAGKAGQAAGFDIGPFEPWNMEFEIYSWNWKLAKGLGYCLPTCKNLAADANEADADCGGVCPTRCAIGKKCKKPSDCANGYCSGGVCDGNNSCADGSLSGTETDKDCGGPSCAKCATGKACLRSTDCASGFCDVKNGVCVADHCTDGAMNADESGKDCGGATCPKCAVFQLSRVEKDCITGVSNGITCVPNSCSDRRLSPASAGKSAETDIDCGGDNGCPRCGEGRKCLTPGDCGSSAPLCDPATRTCQRLRCSDGVQNNDESDVDCGGSCTTKCAPGKKCKDSSDCQGGGGCEGVCYPP